MVVIMAVISRPKGAAVVVVMSERYRYPRGSACARSRQPRTGRESRPRIGRWSFGCTVFHTNECTLALLVARLRQGRRSMGETAAAGAELTHRLYRTMWG